MQKPKVIGIGFHKTGTSTLDAVLTHLDYSVLGARTDLAKDLLEGNLGKALAITEKYDAFQDNPWPLLYKELDKKYPGSKFILTYREDDKWIKSIVNHFGRTKSKMREWIYGIGFPENNEELYLNKYRAHYKEVKNYFKNREKDLLLVDWEKGDGWAEICLFLNKRIPKTQFPHKNKGNYRYKSSTVRKLISLFSK